LKQTKELFLRRIALVLAFAMVFGSFGVLPTQALDIVNITPQVVSVEVGSSVELETNMPVVSWSITDSAGAAVPGVTITPILIAPSNADAFEREVFDLTNAERAAYGLPPLIWHYGLAHVARMHSLDMALNNFMAHDSFDGRTFSQRITQAGISWTNVAENVARGQQSPQAVVNAWMNSPDHRANILNPSRTHLGVGFQTGTGTFSTNWTQKFATTTTPGDTPLPISRSATVNVAATVPVGTVLTVTATNVYGTSHTTTVTTTVASGTVTPTPTPPASPEPPTPTPPASPEPPTPTPPPVQPTPPPTYHSILIWDGGQYSRSNVPHAPAGQTITIDAGLAPWGYVFSHWTTSPAALTINFESPTSSLTTFVMPNQEVNVVVEWERTVLEAIHITPANSTITRGRSRNFGISATGNHMTVPRDVTWSIVDSGHAELAEGTFITPNGLLVISRNQPYTTLTIRATSIFDNSIYDEALVRVVPVEEDLWTPAPVPTPTPDEEDDEEVETPSVGGVDVDYTIRNRQVTFNITVNESRRIITASTNVVVIDVTSTPYSVVQLPTNIVTRFAAAELGLEIHFAFGVITLDAEALYSLASQVATRFVTISLVEVAVDSLLEAQQDALYGKVVSLFQIRANAGLRVITELDGELTISIIYVSDEPVNVWLLDNYGDLELLELLEPTFEVELADNEHLLIFTAPLDSFVVIGN